jgi:ubiquinone biosynthesis protein
MWLSGAIEALAPDLDLLAEVQHVTMEFLARHGARLTEDLGVDLATVQVDPEGFKAAMGLGPETSTFTWKDMQRRRAVIESRLREQRRSSS